MKKYWVMFIWNKHYETVLNNLLKSRLARLSRKIFSPYQQYGSKILRSKASSATIFPAFSMRFHNVCSIVVATTMIVMTGCARIPLPPIEKLTALPDLARNAAKNNTGDEKISSVEHYTGTMTWQMNDRATDALCNARINTVITLTLDVTPDGAVTGEGAIAYDGVYFDPSFVAPQCPSCHIVGTDGTLRITGKRVADQTTTLELHPALWSGLTERQTTAQCQSDAQNGAQTTHHIAFSLQQAGFFDTWRADTEGLPTNFDFNVALRSASGILTLKKNP